MKIYIDFFEIMCYNEHKSFQKLLQNANYVVTLWYAKAATLIAACNVQ